MPSLPSCNHFEVLANICDSETITSDVQKPISAHNLDIVLESTPTSTHTTPFRVQKSKWEKALPKTLTIATIGGISTSLNLKVEIETIDMAERKSVIALLDSSSTGKCIDRNYAKSCQFNLIKLTQPIPVSNIDGTPNKAGSITEVVSLILHHKNHSKWTTFCITNLGKQKLILGHSWLCQHNLKINWTQGETKMSRCPPHCCSGCRKELQQERITQKAEARKTDICLAGFLPEIDHDSDCEADFELGSRGSEDETH